MQTNEISEVISIIARALSEAGIEYAITGSVASGVHGEPTATQDVDIIVQMTEAQARALARALPPRFYRNEDSLAQASRTRGLVNVLDMDTAFKIDLSVVPLTPFHRSVFERRQSIAFESERAKIDVVSPEDIILMKLLWRRDSMSEKQWRDALGVARVKGARMDWKYLFGQARSLGIEEDLINLRNEAGI